MQKIIINTSDGSFTNKPDEDKDKHPDMNLYHNGNDKPTGVQICCRDEKGNIKWDAWIGVEIVGQSVVITKI